jgi:hypothetical protein
MTFGILAAAALFYLFCVEHLDLFEDIKQERTGDWIVPGRFDHTDWKTVYFGGQRLGSFHLYSFVFVLAASISFGLMSNDAVFGVSPENTPTCKPRRVQVLKDETAVQSEVAFSIAGNGDPPEPEHPKTTVMMIDGNRNGRYVLFDHDQHALRRNGESGCTDCHHMNQPFDRSTGCYECHSDVYTAVDIFNHDLHMRAVGGNHHCQDCHVDSQQPKTRANTKACRACHKAMVVASSRVKASTPRIDSRTVGYVDAMHGLCIDCHKETQTAKPELGEAFSQCAHCHQSYPDLADSVWDQLR